MDARAIVVRAADGVRSSKEAEIWLRNDEAGSWERQARELLERHGEGMRAAGLSEEQRAEWIAGELRLLALRAILASAKERRKR